MGQNVGVSAVQFVGSINQAKGFIHRTTETQEPSQLHFRLDIARIKLHNGPQDRDQPLPVTVALFDLGQSLPRWQQILFDFDGIPEFHAGASVVVRRKEFHAAFVIALGALIR